MYLKLTQVFNWHTFNFGIHCELTETEWSFSLAPVCHYCREGDS